MQAQIVSPTNQATRRSRGQRQRWHTNGWAYLYLAPMLVLLIVFSIYPIIASAIYTLYNWDGIGQPSAFVGLQNFHDVITDHFFWSAFAHTFIFTGAVVSIQLTLALVLALVLNNPNLKFSTFYRAVYFLPVVTSQAVIGLVIQLLLTNVGGDLNKFLLNAHITHAYIDWLGDPFWAFVVLITIGIWNYLGINLVNFLAALQSVPTELYEAARMDGANAMVRFFSITIPLLRNVGLVIITLAVLGSLGTFDLVQVVTGGGPYFATETVATYIYHKAFGSFGGPGTTSTPNLGFASAASFFFGVTILGLTLGQIVIARNAARMRADMKAS